MKQKVITALIILAIVIPLIILGGIYFKVALGIVSVLAYKEIIDLKFKNTYMPNIIKFLGLIDILFLIFFKYQSISLIILLLTLLVPVVFINDRNIYSAEHALYLTAFILLIGLSFNSLINIRFLGLKYFIYLLFITIMTDTFAQIIGMFIGKHQLTSISPKKTIEGSIGGTIMGTLLASIYYLFFISSNIDILLLSSFTLIISIVAQIGDLFFSSIKRLHNKKDFSNIIPGHGGILDRLDSLIFASMAFMILARFL